MKYARCKVTCQEVADLLNSLAAKAGYKEYHCPNKYMSGLCWWALWYEGYTLVVEGSAAYSGAGRDLSLDEMVKFLTEGERVVVTLNAEYKAEVTKEGVTVGCQKFPLSVVRELAKAVDKVEGKN